MGPFSGTSSAADNLDPSLQMRAMAKSGISADVSLDWQKLRAVSSYALASLVIGPMVMLFVAFLLVVMLFVIATWLGY